MLEQAKFGLPSPVGELNMFDNVNALQEVHSPSLSPLVEDNLLNVPAPKGGIINITKDHQSVVQSLDSAKSDGRSSQHASVMESRNSNYGLDVEQIAQKKTLKRDAEIAAKREKVRVVNEREEKSRPFQSGVTHHSLEFQKEKGSAEKRYKVLNSI